MARIAVAEDDPGTRKLLSVVISRMGHEVFEAVDGAQAWELIRKLRPAVIVSDVTMPGMNGFELLERVRKDPELALTPFILLTSLQERKDMRQGMRMGADDFITKPFQSTELRDAINAQLNKQATRRAEQAQAIQGSLGDALEEQARDLTDQYEDRLARALSEQWPSGNPGQVESSLSEATVLFGNVCSYRDWFNVLSADEVGQLVKRFYERSGDTVFLFGALGMQLVDEGVVAVFADKSDARGTSHSLRATRAALGLRSAAASLRSFVQQQFPDRELPLLEIGVALHSGPVSMMRLEGLLGGAPQIVPVGETVADTIAIQRHAQTAPGKVTVSVGVLRRITGAVKPGKRQLLSLPQRGNPVDVCEVEPLVP